MTRYFCLSGGLTLIVAMSCAQQNSPLEHLPVTEHASPPPEPDPSQPVIRGSWALPVATNDVRIPGGKVERRDQEIRVSLAVEDFEKPGFDRSGYWDQSGIYEHAYGGDRSGSLSYRFTGMDLIPEALKFKARLCAESQTQGKP
ncbi:MAG: hypothetical protein M3Q07_22395, partial [Pseudobdellovibrionaceae bacterium]|nr:hypothetical protein [Pseudobdellovibrionaceae bacterium]